MRHRVLLTVGIVTLIAGIAMTATDNGVVVVTIGLVLLGIGAVMLVSLAFLAVGESEDRHRERNPGGWAGVRQDDLPPCAAAFHNQPSSGRPRHPGTGDPMPGSPGGGESPRIVA
jgi:hypothetical protein